MKQNVGDSRPKN